MCRSFTFNIVFTSFLSAFSLVLSTALPAHAINTNMYEKEAPKTDSVTTKVRVVRDVSDEVEVFFDSDKARGAYSLPRKTKDYGAALKLLVDSSKAQGPSVTVTLDADNKIILSVQKANDGAAPLIDAVKDFDKIFK